MIDRTYAICRENALKVVPELDFWTLFLVLIAPGLISMHVYRVLFAARKIDWKVALVQGLFYSVLNLVACLPILVLIHQAGFWENHPYRYTAGLMAVLLVFPVAWPLLYRYLIKWQWLASKVQLPYDSAWDYFFERKMPVFVVLQLRNGSRFGGYFGPRSYATSFPTEGDIYLETVYKVDEEGNFTEPVEDTDGAIIRKDQYDLIEFFKVPEEK